MPFSAVAQYAVRGTSDVSRKSQQVRAGLKAGKPTTLAAVAKAVGETGVPGAPLHGVFGQDVIAVPAPGSAVARAGSLSVPHEVCRCLLDAGLIGDVQVLLARTAAVPKSAYAGSDRPDANRHFETIGLTGLPLVAGARLLVVDDVVTTGRTLLACVSRLLDGAPGAQVAGFAVLRAISYGEIETIRHPCTGTIHLVDDLVGMTHRDP